MNTLTKSPDQLQQEEIQRQALEAAARKLEERAGNKLYKAAWKTAARMIRELKPG